MAVKAGKSVLTSKIEAEIELLQRHVQMLKAIMDNEPIGIIRLSEMLRHPQHKVRYSLSHRTGPLRRRISRSSSTT